MKRIYLFLLALSVHLCCAQDPLGLNYTGPIKIDYWILLNSKSYRNLAPQEIYEGEAVLDSLDYLHAENLYPDEDTWGIFTVTQILDQYASLLWSRSGSEFEIVGIFYGFSDYQARLDSYESVGDIYTYSSHGYFDLYRQPKGLFNWSHGTAGRTFLDGYLGVGDSNEAELLLSLAARNGSWRRDGTMYMCSAYHIDYDKVAGSGWLQPSGLGYFHAGMDYDVVADFVDWPLKGTDQIDMYYAPPGSCIDNDEDGYGMKGSDISGCSFAEHDCDDFSAAIHPNAIELCDGIDNDCNGKTDDSCAASAVDLVRSFIMGSNVRDFFVNLPTILQ